jgi:hypothetical protein
MTEKFVSFLFKRIVNKLDCVEDASTQEELYAHVDDLREYLDELKTVIHEAITP